MNNTHTKNQNILRRSAPYVSSALVIIASVLVTQTAFAAVEVGEGAATSTSGANTGYTFLAPINLLQGVGETIDLKTTGFDVYVRALINVIIGMTAVIGVVRLVMVALEVYSNPGKADVISSAKKTIKNIAWSFGLIAGSWVILNTINPALVKGTSIINPVSINVPYSLKAATERQFDPPPGGDDSSDPQVALDNSTEYDKGWYISYDKERVNDTVEKTIVGFAKFPNKDSCEDQHAKETKGYEEGKTAGSKRPYDRWGYDDCFEKTFDKLSEDEVAVRKQLSEAGVPVNRARSCNAKVTTACTNVGSYVDDGKSYGPLGGATVGKIIALAGKLGQSPDNCPKLGAKGCHIIITGGTEHWGHKSHGKPGTFDLAKTSELTKFLMENATIQAPSFVKERYFYDGIWYTDEDEKHYHQCVEGADSRAYCNPPDPKGCLDFSKNPPSERKAKGMNLMGPTVMKCK